MNKHLSIIKHYEECLRMYGDTHKGVDWPNAKDLAKRYKVMLDLVHKTEEDKTLLDFGCGASHFYQYIIEQDVQTLNYVGLDASQAFVDLSKSKYPDNQYICLDVLAEPEKLQYYDYVVMNGVFTEKRQLTFDDMYEYLRKILTIVFSKTRRGISFNLMSKQVDWERDDLFHMPIGELTNFLAKSLSRHYTIRNDYGLYEYTVYVYKEPS